MLAMNFQVFACDVSVKIKQLHQLSLDTEILKLNIANQLESKGYLFVRGQALYNMKINLSKGKDFRFPDKLFAKASLSLYKASQMLNYTHGQGKVYSTHVDAYKLDMYLLALKNAIYHLPHCSNLP